METTINYNELSMVKQIALRLLDEIRDRVINDCSDEEIMTNMAKLDAKHNGYIKTSELMTYDKAMSKLGIKNRNTFSALCKKHNVKNVKINNVNVGFYISDIERLSQIVNR
jgi:hypothetical protein